MILITQNWNIPSFGFKHEFGHEAFPKMFYINLLFMTIFITRGGKKSKLKGMMYDYIRNDGSAESIPQYREQVKRIKSKARAQAKKDYEQQLDWVTQNRDTYYKKYANLESKVSTLRNLAYQVRKVKAMSDEELNNI